MPPLLALRHCGLYDCIYASSERYAWQRIQAYMLSTQILLIRFDMPRFSLLTPDVTLSFFRHFAMSLFHFLRFSFLLAILRYAAAFFFFHYFRFAFFIITLFAIAIIALLLMRCTLPFAIADAAFKVILLLALRLLPPYAGCRYAISLSLYATS